MSATYDDVIASKVRASKAVGFTVGSIPAESSLFPFQAAIVRWALRRGRSAAFADTGLGKSRMELAWVARAGGDGDGRGGMTLLAPAEMRNPFVIPGPALLSFSGGRTSGVMLRRMLDAHGGTLPADTYVVFANTGKERPETLDFVQECSERWAVRIHWIEYAGKGTYHEADYASASRDGEPFAKMIEEKRYLPNTVTRFCTEILKVKGFAWFMAERGYGAMGDWPNIVGMRADEPRRVAKLARRNDEDGEDNRTPRAASGCTKADVFAFWASQPFDLRLQRWEGNCDLCFLKGLQIRVRTVRDKPEIADFWQEQEEGLTAITGKSATFDKSASIKQIRFLAELPLLPGFDEISDDDSAGIPCMCSD